MPAAALFDSGMVCGALEMLWIGNARTMLVGALHVAHDDGEVLEPEIVRAAVDGDRLTAGRQVLLQLDALVSELQRRAAHARAEHAGQIVVVAVGDDAFADLLESERLLVESARRCPDWRP